MQASPAPPGGGARGVSPAEPTRLAPGAVTGAAVWAGAVSPAKPRGANSSRPALAGPFDKGEALPRGVEALEEYMSARGNDATL